MANLPPFLSKAFKLSSAARQAMAANSNEQGRMCELDPTNDKRVLTWAAGQSDGFDEMGWSQKKLYEAAQKGKLIIGNLRRRHASFIAFYTDECFQITEASSIA